MTADGLVLIDKPSDWTSHDVVAKTRRLAGTRKVGHAGTLDPMATGLLVLGVNRATRLLTYIVGADKTYNATIRLGQSTITDDAEGEVSASAGASVDAAAVQAAITELTGDIEQVPSSVSAIKVDGQRSYARVRSGQDVKLAARGVRIARFDVVGPLVSEVADDGTSVVDVPVTVECSSGTYIRALARDLGAALGTGGHLTALRRTKVGSFEVSAAQDLAALIDGRAELAVHGITEVCTDLFDVVSLTEEQARAIRYGQWIDADGAGQKDPVPVLAARTPQGDVIALLEAKDQKLKPVLVFDPA